MHHIVLERWSRGASFLHRRDPRAKTIALLALLAALGTAHRAAPLTALVFLALLCATLLWARVPLAGALFRASFVLPFSGVLAAASWLAGDHGAATALILKSYVSALAALTVVATTPLPVLLRGLELMKAPVFLLTITQFLYRYLFVISEEAQHMKKAAAARGAHLSAQSGARSRFHAAAGALAVLFARSYGRAEDVHRAMLARGFEGRLRTLAALRFSGADAAFTALASAIVILLRVGLERIAS